MQYLINIIFKNDMFADVGGLTLSIPTLASYVLEWMFHIFFIIICIVLRRFTQPRIQDFSLLDPSISKRYYANNLTAFPVFLLFISAIFLPFCISFFINYQNKRVYSIKQKLWNIHTNGLAILFANSLQVFLVSVLKSLVGKPRPDLISRCNPDYNIPTTNPARVVDVTVCRNNARGVLLLQGFQSFPSGHAAAASTNFIILFVTIARNFNIFNKKKDSISLLGYGFPLVMILIINATSVSDHRHFIGDVIAGDILGFFASLVSLNLYYKNPLKFNQNSYLKPFGPRRFFMNSQGSSVNKEGVFIFDEDEEGEEVGEDSKSNFKMHTNSANNLTNSSNGVNNENNNNDKTKHNHQQNTEPSLRLSSLIGLRKE